MMTRDDALAVCEGFRSAVEDYPFREDVAVFKVGGKMFALVMLIGGGELRFPRSSGNRVAGPFV